MQSVRQVGADTARGTGSVAPVTVVIPCYRCGGTVRRAVESVLAQSWPPAEIILVDDASPDDTGAVLQGIACQFPDLVRLIRRPVNGGPAAARNAGWNGATQPFVAFLDADDSWHPRKLELQVGYMLAHPEVALSGHRWFVVDGRASPPPVPDHPRVSPVTFRRLLFSNCFATPSVVLRRDLPFRFHEGRRFSEDYLLWLLITACGYRAVLLEAALTYLHKAPYGAGGLTVRLWSMERSEIANYWFLRRDGKLSWPAALFFSCWSLTKYLRRLALLRLDRLRRAAVPSRAPSPLAPPPASVTGRLPSSSVEPHCFEGRTRARVLHVITLSSWGGAQQVCYDLVTHLDPVRFACEVACTPGGELVPRLSARGIPVHLVPFLHRDLSPLRDLAALWALWRLMRTRRYQIVHCHSTKAGIVGRLAARLAGVPCVFFTAHGWGFYNQAEYGFLRSFLVLLERAAARLSTRVVCVSDHDRASAVAHRIAPPGKLAVIRNGIAPEALTATGELRRLVGAAGCGAADSCPGESGFGAVGDHSADPTNQVLIGMVARLAYPKDPLTYLGAARQVLAQEPEARFVLIGDGPLRPACEAYIRVHGLGNRVFVLGHRADARRLIADLDIFVLSSQFEGLPMTVLEAMAVGVPVVATDVGGVGEMISDGSNGFLVPPRCPDVLAERLLRLARDPGLRAAMGSSAREVVRSRFDLGRMVRDYENLYLSSLAAARGDENALRRKLGGSGVSACAPEATVAPSAYVLSRAKRLLDFALAGVGLLLSLPLWVVISLAIVADDGGPVLYAQERVGKDGRPFTLLKFRSMTRDAERATGPVLASASDPRVTRVGRLLRATALDELPQLVNILLGHMSFVGPRPERPELVAEIVSSCPEFALRHLVKPGLTGLAQVYGHYETEPCEKLAYDLEYIRSATFWGDIRLILRSFLITLSARWQERSGHLNRTARWAGVRRDRRKSAGDRQ